MLGLRKICQFMLSDNIIIIESADSISKDGPDHPFIYKYITKSDNYIAMDT